MNKNEAITKARSLKSSGEYIEEDNYLDLGLAPMRAPMLADATRFSELLGVPAIADWPVIWVHNDDVVVAVERWETARHAVFVEIAGLGQPAAA